MDQLRFVRADFEDLEPYIAVKPLDVLAKEIGVGMEQIAKLDANENLYGPHPAVRDAIANADLHIYPDPGQDRLRQALGEYVGVSASKVVAGSGADDLIDILIRLVAPPAIAVAPPSFGMYAFLARIAGASVFEAPRSAEHFGIDIEGIRRAVTEGARMLFVASPNNPTGGALKRTEVQELCTLDALVVVDEAYIEFGGESSVGLLDDFPNLVVLRTFSKWAALAGLRVGYAICREELAAAMMSIKQPYNVNAAADVAARAALAHRDEIFEQVRCIVSERNRISSEVGALGWLRPYPSVANFVLDRKSVV